MQIVKIEYDWHQAGNNDDGFCDDYKFAEVGTVQREYLSSKMKAVLNKDFIEKTPIKIQKHSQGKFFRISYNNGTLEDTYNISNVIWGD